MSAPAPVLLRPALEQDLPQLAALEAESMGEDAWSPDQVREELAADHRVRLVAVDGDTDAVVGWVDIAFSLELADLLRVAVSADHRRRGIGEALVAAGVDALAPTVTRMLLEVAESNTAARALYARRGWAEIDRRRDYYRAGDDALVLERLLDPAREESA